MKTLVIITLLATLAQTFAAEPLNYYNPKGTEEDSFRTPELKRLSLPGFSPEHSLSIEFVANTPEAARAPYQPAVRVKTPGVDRWIQFLEVNVPAGKFPPQEGRGHQLLDKPFPWLFVDCFDANRKKGIPFYYSEVVPLGADFFDTPSWGMPARGQADGERRWVASCFAVRVSGQSITAIAGFRWGYRWKVDQRVPVALEPVALDRKDWETFARLISKQYEDWTFQ